MRRRILRAINVRTIIVITTGTSNFLFRNGTKKIPSRYLQRATLQEAPIPRVHSSVARNKTKRVDLYEFKWLSYSTVQCVLTGGNMKTSGFFFSWFFLFVGTCAFTCVLVRICTYSKTWRAYSNRVFPVYVFSKGR